MVVIGDNFFDGLQVVFGSLIVWSEVSTCMNDATFLFSSTFIGQACSKGWISGGGRAQISHKDFIKKLGV